MYSYKFIVQFNDGSQAIKKINLDYLDYRLAWLSLLENVSTISTIDTIVFKGYIKL